MKRLINDQNAGLVCNWILPSSSPRCNWCIGKGLDGLIMSTCICLFGCTFKDHKVVAKAACVSIRICFVS